MATAIVTAKIQLMQSEESSQRFLSGVVISPPPFPPPVTALIISSQSSHWWDFGDPLFVLAFITFPCCLPWEFLPGSPVTTHRQLLAWLFKPCWPHQARPAWQPRWHTRQRNTGVRDRGENVTHPVRASSSRTHSCKGQHQSDSQTRSASRYNWVCGTDKQILNAVY